MSNENRWIQRLQNLNKAFQRLANACAQGEYNELEVAGLVQTYEFTFELCWKTLKDKLTFEGYELNSPREVIKKAFEMSLLTDVDQWLEALESRNLFNHTYDDEIARQATALIKDKLEPMLRACVATLMTGSADDGPSWQPHIRNKDKRRKLANRFKDNRAISTMQVLEELITLAKEMDAATKRGKDLGLTDDEVAFYDALAANESAVQAMGDDKLKVIAAELITKVRQSVTIDWTLRESARAKIRVMVKRILNKYGYPPDLQEEAVKTVLAQAELLCAEWA